MYLYKSRRALKKNKGTPRIGEQLIRRSLRIVSWDGRGAHSPIGIGIGRVAPGGESEVQERGRHGYITRGIPHSRIATAAIEGSAISPCGFGWGARHFALRFASHLPIRVECAALVVVVVVVMVGQRGRLVAASRAWRTRPRLSITDCWYLMNVSFQLGELRRRDTRGEKSCDFRELTRTTGW